jgi:hypothetical protein
MSFLTLPREIRNQIYFFVIHLERDAPQSPLHESVLGRYKIKDKQSRRRDFEPVHYESGNYWLSYTSLLCANRQVQAELQEAVVAVQNAGNLMYKVDLMVSGQAIYPTWLSVPAPAKHLAELVVDYRRVDCTKGAKWVGNGGPGLMTQRLARILSRFIVHGPAFFGNTDSEPETRFEVLTLRLLNTESLQNCTADEMAGHAERYEMPTLEDDLMGLNICADGLAAWHILGQKCRLIRVQYGDDVREIPIPEKPPSEEHLELWSHYGWYRGPLSP